MNMQQSDTGKRGRFFIEQDSRTVAKMTYSWAGETSILIDHTAVDASLKGKGVGKQQVAQAVAFARERRIKIIPLCPFARSVFEKVPECRDVLSYTFVMQNRETMYANGETTVVWRPTLCQYAGVCVKMLPQEYNPAERPWVKVGSASTVELAAQIKSCPSGALGYLVNNGAEAEAGKEHIEGMSAFRRFIARSAIRRFACCCAA